MVNTRTKSTSKLSIKKENQGGEETTRPKSRLKTEAPTKSPKLYIKQEKEEPRDSDGDYVPPARETRESTTPKAESKPQIKSEFTLIFQCRDLGCQGRGRRWLELSQEGTEDVQG